MARIETHARAVDDLMRRYRAIDGGDMGAVARGVIVHEVRRHDVAAARHVFHDHRGIAGDVTGHMPRHGARRRIVGTGDARRCDERDCFAREEFFDVVGSRAACRYHGNGSHEDNTVTCTHSALPEFRRSGSFEAE